MSNNIPLGWQCPVCGRVYSPGTPECTECAFKAKMGIHSPSAHSLGRPDKCPACRASISEHDMRMIMRELDEM